MRDERPINPLAQPRSLTHEGRCDLLREIAECLRSHKLPSREARAWFVGAFDSFCNDTTPRAKFDKHLRIARPGSHRTARFLLTGDDEKQK